MVMWKWTKSVAIYMMKNAQFYQKASYEEHDVLKDNDDPLPPPKTSDISMNRRKIKQIFNPYLSPLEGGLRMSTYIHSHDLVEKQRSMSPSYRKFRYATLYAYMI